ncbi:hypothetical protein T08_15569 [Trichinella sp. T8]|nr:hypothetical protein T08_15569 [Trichinella sp. T8]
MQILCPAEVKSCLHSKLIRQRPRPPPPPESKRETRRKDKDNEQPGICRNSLTCFVSQPADRFSLHLMNAASL